MRTLVMLDNWSDLASESKHIRRFMSRFEKEEKGIVKEQLFIATQSLEKAQVILALCFDPRTMERIEDAYCKKTNTISSDMIQKGKKLVGNFCWDTQKRADYIFKKNIKEMGNTFQFFDSQIIKKVQAPFAEDLFRRMSESQFLHGVKIRQYIDHSKIKQYSRSIQLDEARDYRGDTYLAIVNAEVDEFLICMIVTEEKCDTQPSFQENYPTKLPEMTMKPPSRVMSNVPSASFSGSERREVPAYPRNVPTHTNLSTYQNNFTAHSNPAISQKGIPVAYQNNTSVNQKGVSAYSNNLPVDQKDIQITYSNPPAPYNPTAKGTSDHSNSAFQKQSQTHSNLLAYQSQRDSQTYSNPIAYQKGTPAHSNSGADQRDRWNSKQNKEQSKAESLNFQRLPAQKKPEKQPGCLQSWCSLI